MSGKLKRKVLFLCTGNSARSQMAEGFLRKYGSDRFEVYSAGIAPVGINPHSVEVMKEIGIDISAQTSDAIDKELLKDVDLVITLCGDARERCPFIPVKVEKKHWPLEDPARAEGATKKVLDEFRKVRDQIKMLVIDLVGQNS